MGYMPSETLTDHSASIRAQIEQEVIQLKRRIESTAHRKADSAVRQDDDAKAQYVEIGALVNLHHGRPVLAIGDTVAGLPVRLGHVGNRTIRVCADHVRFIEETEEWDDDLERMRTEERVFHQDLSESAIW